MNKSQIEQESKQAAELKAKLDMVTTRTKSKYGRNHRKIGEMVCDTGIRAGYRNVTASFVLRLNAVTGEFIAEHGDAEYASKSRDALKARMDQIAKVTLDLKWTRYLLVDYKAEVMSDRYNGTCRLDITDQRKKDVLGISLNWEVVEYSDAFELPGEARRFMRRAVDDEGEPSGVLENVRELPDGLIPYTKERRDVLRRLRAALGEVDAKMVNLFRGDPDRVGRQLDDVRGDPLALGAPRSTRRKG